MRSSRRIARVTPAFRWICSVGFTTLNVAGVRDGTVDAAFVRPPLLEPDLEQLDLGREALVVRPARAPSARPPASDLQREISAASSSCGGRGTTGRTAWMR